VSYSISSCKSTMHHKLHRTLRKHSVSMVKSVQLHITVQCFYTETLHTLSLLLAAVSRQSVNQASDSSLTVTHSHSQSPLEAQWRSGAVAQQRCRSFWAFVALPPSLPRSLSLSLAPSLPPYPRSRVRTSYKIAPERCRGTGLGWAQLGLGGMV